MPKIKVTTIVETPSGIEMAERWETDYDRDFPTEFQQTLDKFNKRLRANEEPRTLKKVLLGHTRWEGTPNPEEIAEMEILWSAQDQTANQNPTQS